MSDFVMMFICPTFEGEGLGGGGVRDEEGGFM